MKFELYDMSADPYQTHDIGGEEPEILNQLVPEMKNDGRIYEKNGQIKQVLYAGSNFVIRS